MKALNVSTPDDFAFERGLKAQGYRTDSERRYQSTWRGFPVEVSIWSKPGRGNPADLLMFRLGNTFRLYKQVDILPFFDGDESEATINQ